MIKLLSKAIMWKITLKRKNKTNLKMIIKTSTGLVDKVFLNGKDYSHKSDLFSWNMYSVFRMLFEKRSSKMIKIEYMTKKKKFYRVANINLVKKLAYEPLMT